MTIEEADKFSKLPFIEINDSAHSQQLIQMTRRVRLELRFKDNLTNNDVVLVIVDGTPHWWIGDKPKTTGMKKVSFQEAFESLSANVQGQLIYYLDLFR